MVVLNRIYTKTGDGGSTALGTGERRQKDDIRVEAYGAVDEANAAIGMARLETEKHFPDVDVMLLRIQNDLFDLGADLCTPPKENENPEHVLRMVASQVTRLEAHIDTLNAELSPLRSFVLPGGTAAAAALHLARTISRRAERAMVTLAGHEPVGTPALQYINRLSDFLFVASRFVNRERGDVLWVPGKER